MVHQVVSNDNTTGSTDGLDERIAELVLEIRTSQSHMESLQELIDEAKDELRGLLQERGSNWSDALGYARLTSEGVRTLYDTRSLDDLIIKDPLHYGWLKDHRSESVVRSSVQVK
jgi:hypothetical protein